MGRLLIIAGILLIIAGILFMAFAKYFGKLPGDFVFGKGNAAFHFPLMTCIIISIIATIVINIVMRIFK